MTSEVAAVRALDHQMQMVLLNRIVQHPHAVALLHALELRDEWTADDVEGWDSLRHTELIIAIEKAFGIRFAIAEMARTRNPGSNVGTLLELIQTKVEARR